MSTTEPKYEIFVGDCVESMRKMPNQSVHCCVTSPPYFGLRDYGVDGQIGLEPTPDEFVAALVSVFREVRRVLRDDGTLWLNLGDSYASTGGHTKLGESSQRQGRKNVSEQHKVKGFAGGDGIKVKDLIGIPWRVAFALQADGWYLRQDIIWHKPNPMPESVRDRCTKAHEYIFLLSKSPRYYFDGEAVKEDAVKGAAGSKFNSGKSAEHQLGRSSDRERVEDGKRNRRSVWSVSTKPFKGAHFATFPPDLIEPCILAGCPVGGTVLDPFGGSGTTAGVAIKNERSAVLCELNPDYASLVPSRVLAIVGRAAPVPVNDNRSVSNSDWEAMVAELIG
jgi:site-specific DNA-methyltransferase (adenine-specific)